MLNVSIGPPNRNFQHDVAWIFYLFEQKLNDSENKLWHWQMEQGRISKCSILHICWWNEKLIWQAWLSLSSSLNQLSYTKKISVYAILCGIIGYRKLLSIWVLFGKVLCINIWCKKWTRASWHRKYPNYNNWLNYVWLTWFFVIFGWLTLTSRALMKRM